MHPNYVARKSILPAFTFLRVILFFLIVPLIILIYNIIALKKEVIEFYDDKIIYKKGVLNKSETTVTFMGVYGDFFYSTIPVTILIIYIIKNARQSAI